MTARQGLNRRRVLTFTALPFALPTFAWTAAKAEDRAFRHALSLFDSIKYPADFKQFDYVNPNAPRGGRIRLGFMGSFDSINPHTLKGDPIDPGVNETLMLPSLDEASTEYGLLAESVWHPDDYSQVVYRLRPEARFHDGQPVTPEDVVFSLETLKNNLTTKAAYYKNISKAEKTGEREVTFTFTMSGNRELPQITGQLPVLPRHWWTGKDATGKPRDVTLGSLEPPLGSAPYQVVEISPGASIKVKRVMDYWGDKLAVNIGRNNFDEITTLVFRDETVLFEAFKGGQFDIHLERTAKQWATGYDFPAVKDGRVLKAEVPQDGVRGMQSWALNLRKPKFQDVRVRRALNLAFDFEWSNANLFYGQYKRSRSYFNNSELEAKGLPSAGELAILTPLKDKLPPEVFTTEYANPVNTTAVERKNNLRAAQKLLSEAGWNGERQGQKQQLKNAKGEIFTLDFTLSSPAFERVALPYKEQLELLGFVVNVRLLDPSAFQGVEENFEYEIIVGSWPQSLSPGNEQREFWTSEFADKKGSRNLIGIKDPAIDAIVDALIAAPNRQALVDACRALDRALMWNHFVVPHWFLPHERMAYWRRLGRPDPLPTRGLGIPAIWWFDAKADAELAK